MIQCRLLLLYIFWQYLICTHSFFLNLSEFGSVFLKNKKSHLTTSDFRLIHIKRYRSWPCRCWAYWDYCSQSNISIEDIQSKREYDCGNIQVSKFSLRIGYCPSDDFILNPTERQEKAEHRKKKNVYNAPCLSGSLLRNKIKPDKYWQWE